MTNPHTPEPLQPIITCQNNNITLRNSYKKARQLRQQTLPFQKENRLPEPTATPIITPPSPTLTTPIQLITREPIQQTFKHHISNHEPWGDSIYHKPTRCFRIYFQNINGIQPNRQGRWEHILKTMFELYKSDIVGLCETGLHWQNPTLQNKIKSTSRNLLKKPIHFQHSNNKSQTL